MLLFSSDTQWYRSTALFFLGDHVGVGASFHLQLLNEQIQLESTHFSINVPLRCVTRMTARTWNQTPINWFCQSRRWLLSHNRTVLSAWALVPGGLVLCSSQLYTSWENKELQNTPNYLSLWIFSFVEMCMCIWESCCCFCLLLLFMASRTHLCSLSYFFSIYPRISMG